MCELHKAPTNREPQKKSMWDRQFEKWLKKNEDISSFLMCLFYTAIFIFSFHHSSIFMLCFCPCIILGFLSSAGSFPSILQWSMLTQLMKTFRSFFVNRYQSCQRRGRNIEHRRKTRRCDAEMYFITWHRETEKVKVKFASEMTSGIYEIYSEI